MITLANNTPGAARLRVVQGALSGAIVLGPGSALELPAAERYALRVCSRGEGFAYERTIALPNGTAHAVALRQPGAGSPPFDVELEGARAPFAVSCENTTPERLAFCVSRALDGGRAASLGPLALSAVVILDPWQSALLDTADACEVTAIAFGFPTEPLRLGRLEGRFEVVAGREPGRPELRRA